MADIIKVVWLCSMHNSCLNEYFKKDTKIPAAWMSEFLELAKPLNNIELHVVTPNLYNNKDADVCIDNVSYHLFKFHSGLLSNRNALVELALRGARNIESKVKDIVNTIKPDIVHLFGAENLYYSVGIKKLIGVYPTLVTYQGFVQWAPVPTNIIKRYVYRKRIESEDYIYRNCKNVSFFSIEEYIKNEFNRMYPNHNLYRLDFPISRPVLDATIVEKKYDVVFWARVTKNKGIEDLIYAIGLLVKYKPNIRALIIGGGADSYLMEIKELVKTLKIGDNIVFAGFQKTKEDVFNLAAQSKVYCLPTYFDAVPSSICEAMFLKIPVVSYPVGGIPFLNQGNTCICLAENRNIYSLADCINNILDDNELANDLVYKAYDRICQLCDNDKIAVQMDTAYNDILGTWN